MVLVKSSLIKSIMSIRSVEKENFSEMNSDIPKVIYMCDKNLNHIKIFSKNWTRLNPNYDIQLYDNPACEEFLLKEFSTLHKEIFNFIKDGPIKADFWRVCILYKYGGIYCDGDNEPIVPIDDFVEEGIDFLTCSSYFSVMNFNFNPNFIMAKKGDSILNKCINMYINWYREQKPYSYWDWSIMKVFTDIIKLPNYSNQDGIYYLDNKKIQILKECPGQNHHDAHNIYKGIRVFNNRYKEYDADKHGFQSFSEHYKDTFEDTLHSIQKYYPPKIKIPSTQLIPLKIHQTFTSIQLNSNVYHTCMINKNINPEYEYFFYDEDDRRNFIQKNYPSEYIEAYDSAIPGATKADLFRYLLLKKEGGIYIDCKSSLFLPCREFIPLTKEFVAFRDLPHFPGTLMTAFIGSVPNHPMLENVISISMFNIRNKLYGINQLDVAGPQTFGRAFNRMINVEELTEIELGEYTNNTEVLGSMVFLKHNGNTFEAFVDKNNNPIVNRVCPNYYNNPNRVDYYTLWVEKRMYK